MCFGESNPKTRVSLAQYGADIPSFRFYKEKLLKGFFIAMFNFVNIMFGMISLVYVNVPLLFALRKTCMLLTVLVEYFIRGKIPTSVTLITTTFIVTGALVAGWEDIVNADETFLGILCILMNNILSVLYNQFLAVYSKEWQITPFQLNFFYAFLTWPFLLVIVFYRDEF